MNNINDPMVMKTVGADQPATHNMWWGYKHVSGTYQAKRYFSQLDTDEAKESPFCKAVVGPFMATDRDEALSIVKSILL